MQMPLLFISFMCESMTSERHRSALSLDSLQTITLGRHRKETDHAVRGGENGGSEYAMLIFSGLLPLYSGYQRQKQIGALLAILGRVIEKSISGPQKVLSSSSIKQSYIWFIHYLLIRISVTKKEGGMMYFLRYKCRL